MDKPTSRRRPLDGGITNRNYRVSLGGSDYVVRMPGKDTDLLGIDRAAERQANDCAAAIGIAPAVAAMLGDPPCIVTAFVEGRAVSAEELLEPATLAEIAAALRALHDRCRPLEARFDSFRIVENYAELVRERGGEVPDEFERAHEVSQRIEAALGGADHDAVPCHNDLLIANLIRGEEQLWLVDWEYAGMGDRYFDLANFAVNNQLGADDRRRFLALYFEREPRRSGARRARADGADVGFPRGDVGPRSERDLRDRVRLRRLWGKAFRALAGGRIGRALRAAARGGGRWRFALNCPTAPAA